MYNAKVGLRYCRKLKKIKLLTVILIIVLVALVGYAVYWLWQPAEFIVVFKTGTSSTGITGAMARCVYGATPKMAIGVIPEVVQISTIRLQRIFSERCLQKDSWVDHIFTLDSTSDFMLAATNINF
ncbi:MAG: hypothetical protein M1361_02210 [Patescibacteria group bacterium]|nr:hypothetical protein [Patescibacteria group bacterium]MCL5224395.1 hypothetical protein [Patescibacteria group bacterium]